MGRMKEICINLIESNGGVIPQEATIADITRMKELEMYNWEQYERHQEKVRLQFSESKNSGETEKVQAAGKIFEESLRENNKQKNKH